MDKMLAHCEESDAMIFVYEGEEHNPTFRCIVGGKDYSHSVRSIESPDYYQWYCEVLGRHLTECSNRAYEHGKEEVQNQIKKALGVST